LFLYARKRSFVKALVGPHQLHRSAQKVENVMVKFVLAGATALSLTLALAVPAAAGDVKNTNAHRATPKVRGVVVNPYVDPSLPIENALRWGYSQGYQYYPSGYGGLYGDGRYPGNTISNRNYPSWW
jgi:hypothetical protein